MEAKYIVAIVAGALFLLLLLIFIILAADKKKKYKLQRQRLEQMYADKNLVKMEYDFLVYDEETEKIFAAQMERSNQMTFSDIDPSSMPAAGGAIFQTVDTDGLEEIVGTYKPE
ncbi:MAG: hypothetical protein K2O89_01275 [Clostridia bacterium]|nr:hypothetical protein [Clostridia bacterium]